MTKKLHSLLSLLFFLLGVWILFRLIQKIGWQELVHTIVQLDIKIIIILLFPLTWYLVQTFAWYRLLQDDGHQVSFWHIFMAKIGSEAVTTIAPMSIMGGDPYRIYLLQKKVSKTVSTASVVVDRTMQTLAIVILLVISLVAAWMYIPLPQDWGFLLPIFTLTFLGLTVYLIILQKKGMFGIVSQWAKKLGIQKKRLEKLTEKIQTLDQQISGFYQKDKKHFFEILFYQFLGRFLGVIEIYLIARLLNIPLGLSHALILTSLTILINMIFAFIPGVVGVLEGSYGFLLYLLNMNPASGVLIQIIRRIRMIVWLILGMFVVMFYHPQKSYERNDAPSGL